MPRQKELIFTTVQNLMNLRSSSSSSPPSPSPPPTPLSPPPSSPPSPPSSPSSPPPHSPPPPSSSCGVWKIGLQIIQFFQCSCTCSVNDMEQQTAHSSIIIAEIKKKLGILEVCIHGQMKFWLPLRGSH